MTYDYENIEVGQNLKAQTARKADVALHKKRFRIITASSFAAVVCAAVVIFFSLGGGPLPDVVVHNSPEATCEGTVFAETDTENYFRIDSEAEYMRNFISVPLACEIGSEKANALFGSDSQPVIINTDDYEAIFDEYGLIPDDMCHSDASAKLKDYSNDFEYFDIYIVLFPANSSNTRYDEAVLEIIRKQAELFYATQDEAVLSHSQPVVKGFLVAVAKELEFEAFSARQISWDSIQPYFKVDMLIDILLTKPGKEYTHEQPYEIAPETSDEIKEIFDMQGPAIHILGDMRLQMDLSSAIIGENKFSLVDGLLNMMVQNSARRNLDYNSLENAFHQYLYEYHDKLNDQPINTCLLFSQYKIKTDYSEHSEGYQTCYMLVNESYIKSKHENEPLFYAAKVRFKIKEGDVWEVVSFERAETENEVYALFGNNGRSYFDAIDSGELENLSQTTQDYFNMWLGEDDFPSLSPTPANAVISDFDEIKRYLLSQYDEVYGSYSAISRDLITYILDKSKGDNVLEIKTMTPLSEDFDNPITVAALSVTYDGSETESQYCKLYVVTAEYDESTWELIDMKIEEKSRLYMAEFPKLKFRGSRYVFLNLQSQLERETKKIGDEFGLDLPEPIIEKNVTSNELNLGFASGTPQFVSVTREIYPEEDAGVTSYMWYVEEDPVWLCDDARLDAIKNAEWEKIAEPTEKNIAGYTVSEPGLVGIRFEVHVENETSLYKAHFTIDAQTRFTTLWLSGINGDSAFYRSYDTAIYDAVVDIFGVDLDVSTFMITSGKGPTLPDYREELRFLVPIVGDMPGGIMSVEATDLSSLSADSGRYENTPVIKDEDALIDWAQEVGAILETCEINDLGGGIIDTIAPDAIWEVNLAPQEGVGSLKIRGFADTGSIIIAKTYRLYGRSDTLYTVYQLNSFELFDKLCELSFGETLRD